MEAVTLTPKEIRAIKRQCRREAKELTQMQYQRYDDIWYTRIRLDGEALSHGREAISDIIAKMPNLFVKSPTASGIDLVSEWFGFESSSDLIDFLLAYSPRGPVEEHFYETLVAERLAPFMPPALDEQYHQPAQSPHDVDDVPF